MLNQLCNLFPQRLPNSDTKQSSPREYKRLETVAPQIKHIIVKL